MVFSVGNKPALEVPMDQVLNTSMASKTEVAIELKPSATSSSKDDQLVEMRFFIPSASTAGKAATAGDDDMEILDADTEDSAAVSFCQFSQLY